MGFFSYLKLGSLALLVIAGSYFYWNYQHLQKENATLKVQNAAQQDAIEWYEKAAKIDGDTAEVHNEIKKAMEANSIDKLRDLYRRLRQHQRLTKDKAPAKAGNGRTDRSGDGQDAEDSP